MLQMGFGVGGVEFVLTVNHLSDTDKLNN